MLFSILMTRFGKINSQPMMAKSLLMTTLVILLHLTVLHLVGVAENLPPIQKTVRQFHSNTMKMV